METLEDLGRKKGIDGRDIFLCTYYMVSKSIAMTGLSRSETIYDLVVRLHYLCMRYRCKVRFIHISGTQMIGQGTDRLSRGRFYEGVMNSKTMLLFLSLRGL